MAMLGLNFGQVIFGEIQHIGPIVQLHHIYCCL